MTQLTKNFTLEELTTSYTAERAGIDNTPSEWVKCNLRLLAENILQPIRDHYGVPVIITSGYRCQQLNETIPNSSKTSQHMKGEAADFRVQDIPNTVVAKWIRDNLDFDQLILEFCKSGQPFSGWVHCSYKNPSGNRKDVITINNDGKFVGLRG